MSEELVWKIEFSRGGRCWGERFTFFVLTVEEERAISIAKKKLPDGSDAHTFRVEAEIIGNLDSIRSGLEAGQEYWDY